MPLPSQSARPMTRRSHMQRSGRRRPYRRVVAVVLLLALALLAWRFWPRSTAPDGAAEDPMLVTGVGAVPGERRGTPPAGDAESAPVPATSTPPAAPQRAATPPDEPSRTEHAVPGAGINPPATPPVTEQARMAPTAIPDPIRAEPAPERRDEGTVPDRTPAGARRAERQMATGFDLLERNEPIEGRRVLSAALLSGGLTDADAARVRARLAALNDDLVFGPRIIPADPYVIEYRLAANDFLSTLPRRLGVQTDWRFIQLVNGISSPQRVRVGQRLKVVTGPFHAIVDKSDYRLDLYMGDEHERVYVRSFPVGLGEYDSTPIGRFGVRPDSKLINPEWVNPRTGERFLPDDPMNPIGEYWIGLVGLDDHLRSLEGYGIHGTIEPDSIGRQASMGCIRMLPDDVALVWDVMMPNVSVVEIVP